MAAFVVLNTQTTPNKIVGLVHADNRRQAIEAVRAIPYHPRAFHVRTATDEEAHNYDTPWWSPDYGDD